MKKRFLLGLLILSVLLVTVIGCKINPTQGAFLEVESTLCLGCGKCVAVCKYDAITVIGNKAVIDPEKCQQCFKCVKVCPYDAIH